MPCALWQQQLKPHKEGVANALKCSRSAAGNGARLRGLVETSPAHAVLQWCRGRKREKSFASSKVPGDAGREQSSPSSCMVASP